MLNKSDFFVLRDLDLENKLYLPTRQLYQQFSFQLNALYQDIRGTLIEAHTLVASTAKQVYDQPTETLTAWYDQAAYHGTLFYAQAHTDLMPTYIQARQFLQAFWHNPEQVTVAALEPVSRYASDIAGQSAHYWQTFVDSPEHVMATALAPVMDYLSALGDSGEALLLSSYYALAELASLLMEQPTATLQALYHNTLSSVLDVYFDMISSLLAMA
jgi:hypothetical protein